jgi:hypothetical protein
MPANAVCLSLLLHEKTLASQNIFYTGDQFHVSWVDTFSISAQMVDHLAVWYFSKAKLIGNPMSHDPTTSARDSSIAIFIYCSIPFPAVVLACSYVANEIPEAPNHVSL